MRNLKIGSLQWWVGAYCSFLGAVLLVTPHNFDLPVTSFLQSRSWIFGTGLVLAGIAMFAAAILVPSRAATLAAHLSVGLLLTAVAVVSWRAHDLLTAIDSLVFGLGTIFAGLIYDPKPPQTPARYNLMTFLLGLVSALMGLLLLALPASIQPLVEVQIWQYIPAFGVLFLAAAWLLFFVLYPLQGAGTASRQWPGIPWLANLAAAFIWLVFAGWALFPTASWTDQAFYAMAAAYLLIYPWLVTYSPFPFRTSLHARFTLMLAVAVAIPVIVTVAWVSQREETTARDRTIARLRHDSSGLASQITDFISRYQAGVQAAAEVPGLIGLDQPAQIQALQLFQGAYPDLRSIALFDREGQPLARSDVLGYTPAVGDPVFEKVRRLLKPQVGLLPSPVNHQPELVFGAPVLEGGKFVGFVEGGVGTGHLTEVVTPHSDDTILNYVLDDTGRTVLASPAQTEESLLALESQPVIAAMLSAQQAAGWLDSNRADGEVVAGFTRISGLGWYVISQQPVADALAPVYSGREIAFGLLLLLVTAAVAAGWWIAGKTTEPLASLSRAVLALGEGDTGVPLPRSRVQEIASLAAAFGDMRARLAARTQERVIAENALRQAKGDLENRVVERTIELTAELEERKRVEKTLRETRNRFQMVVDHSPLIVFTTDRDLRYTWIYPAWEGFSPDALIGRQDAEIFPAGSVDEMTWLKETSLKTGRGTRGEVTLKIGNTQSIYDMSVEPLLNEQGVLSGLSVAAMDITERRRLEEEMRRSRGQIEMQHRLIQQRELERLEIARDLHDGPVQELVGMNYTLASAAQEAGQSPLGETIQAVNRTIVKLIDDLRSFAGELRPPSMAKFGVARAIHSQVETFTQKHPEIQVDLDLEEDGQALPEQARLVLYRICQEALNNISRHAQASQVQVHLRLAAGRAILEVEDNGLGFNPPEDWLELARHGHLGVVGMRERAEALGGNLVLRSVPGEGTWIHVQVPVEPSAEVGGENLPG